MEGTSGGQVLMGKRVEAVNFLQECFLKQCWLALTEKVDETGHSLGEWRGHTCAGDAWVTEEQQPCGRVEAKSQAPRVLSSDHQGPSLWASVNKSGGCGLHALPDAADVLNYGHVETSFHLTPAPCAPTFPPGT